MVFARSIHGSVLRADFLAATVTEGDDRPIISTEDSIPSLDGCMDAPIAWGHVIMVMGGFGGALALGCAGGAAHGDVVDYVLAGILTLWGILWTWLFARWCSNGSWKSERK